MRRSWRPGRRDAAFSSAADWTRERTDEEEAGATHPRDARFALDGFGHPVGKAYAQTANGRNARAWREDASKIERIGGGDLDDFAAFAGRPAHGSERVESLGTGKLLPRRARD